ncbi:MAG: hypothetical protein ABSC48_09720 [Terracidiphilus sp.]|jgi:putative NADPH-quinone reductase
MDYDADAQETSGTKEADLAEDYRQMTADVKHEMEAEEWTEHILFELE